MLTSTTFSSLFLFFLTCFLSFVRWVSTPFLTPTYLQPAGTPRTTSIRQSHWLRALAAWRRLKLTYDHRPPDSRNVCFYDFGIVLCESSIRWMEGWQRESSGLVEKCNSEVEAPFLRFWKVKVMFLYECFEGLGCFDSFLRWRTRAVNVTLTFWSSFCGRCTLNLCYFPPVAMMSGFLDCLDFALCRVEFR
jgi:hypothetical protein